jgi:hypothetical protein
LGRSILLRTTTTNKNTYIMKTKYYKSLPDSLAKTRISKLVEASREAWDMHHKISKYSETGDIVYDIALEKAIGLSDSLRVMGICEYEWEENL